MIDDTEAFVFAIFNLAMLLLVLGASSVQDKLARYELHYNQDYQRDSWTFSDLVVVTWGVLFLLLAWGFWQTNP